MEASYCLSKPRNTTQQKLVHTNASCRLEFSFKWKCNPIEVDGLLDVVVEDYTEWQHFRYTLWPSGIVWILSKVYRAQNPGLFVKHGVKVGAPGSLFMASAFKETTQEVACIEVHYKFRLKNKICNKEP
ncbi:hypothetical protein N7491_011222 [Penicillium cf. griseofulvum]|uniref:Uncharacterized protein n=1 Tax=Penicillium cf. griseofulvum TaxID=2972120 RepID=A0A9W9N2E7_9EURO|nr:hypothetical protein N7472_001542 [Penicillium cf. griseofulvum]KAJ5422777.1 hypothetical protein N7491_011222 [Penicillium cf. griseofulvum]KAJ5428956.1 hypothetical protein N7445_010410 [Penicillium cf. griseofulvum]